MEVTLNFFFRFLRWSPHELLVFLNVPLIWGSENSQCFDSKPSGKVVISLQKSHFVSLILYFFCLQTSILWNSTDWFSHDAKKMLSLIMRGKERKKSKCWENNMHLHLLFIENSLNFPLLLLLSLYIFWHLKNGFHVW